MASESMIKSKFGGINGNGNPSSSMLRNANNSNISRNNKSPYRQQPSQQSLLQNNISSISNNYAKNQSSPLGESKFYGSKEYTPGMGGSNLRTEKDYQSAIKSSSSSNLLGYGMNIGLASRSKIGSNSNGYNNSSKKSFN